MFRFFNTGRLLDPSRSQFTRTWLPSVQSGFRWSGNRVEPARAFLHFLSDIIAKRNTNQNKKSDYPWQLSRGAAAMFWQRGLTCFVRLDGTTNSRDTATAQSLQHFEKFGSNGIQKCILSDDGMTNIWDWVIENAVSSTCSVLFWICWESCAQCS